MTMTPGGVPSYRALQFAPRQYEYALVIPVINEGDRIRGQLQELDGAWPVDVIIADGGSTDGSLDSEFLQLCGVRALLVKTGPGKLSAQLRMGYSWALAEGYQGIVTVDGNGKDGIAAIPEFLAKLQEGYDYVQGSRYLPGGRSINTPWDRHLAGRWVHAPLISLAARHRFTDTTNGFRGYSARFLNDPRVAPLRDVFREYNLLFYLSIRAGQLGMRCIEVPVERRYPANLPPPTKVSGFRGRLRMMGELAGAIAGAYDPKRRTALPARDSKAAAATASTAFESGEPCQEPPTTDSRSSDVNTSR